MKACMFRYIWNRFTVGLSRTWQELKFAVAITLVVVAAGSVVYGIKQLLRTFPDVVVLVLAGGTVLAIIANKIRKVVQDAKQYCEGEGK